MGYHFFRIHRERSICLVSIFSVTLIILSKELTSSSHNERQKSLAIIFKMRFLSTLHKFHPLPLDFSVPSLAALNWREGAGGFQLEIPVLVNFDSHCSLQLG